MSLIKFATVALSLAFISSAAWAFQEQETRAAPQAAKPAEVAPDAVAPSAKAVGPDVRIPGLGKLGSLPKMDFGLELLYGATEQKNPEAQGRDENRDDLTIRGSVKHSF
jgi:hypothetical protein